MAKNNSKRGVSTVIGMAIFLIIFSMSAAYTFIWTQYFADYSGAVKSQLEFEQQRASEMLFVQVKKAGNDYSLLVTNPTGQVIIVTQVWSNHEKQINLEGWGVAPFSSIEINLAPNENFGNEFKIITSRGNAFYGKYVPPEDPQAGRWTLIWYRYTDGGEKINLGVSYLDSLNLDFRWRKDSYQLGFKATTYLKALGDQPRILLYTPIIGSPEVTITFNGKDTTGAPLIELSTTEGGVYPIVIEVKAQKDYDMNLMMTFIGFDFAKE